MIFTKEWAKAAGIRALKTFAQTAVAAISIGAAFDEIDWLRVLSVAAVAALCSVFTSLGGLPEITEGGEVK